MTFHCIYQREKERDFIILHRDALPMPTEYKGYRLLEHTLTEDKDFAYQTLESLLMEKTRREQLLK